MTTSAVFRVAPTSSTARKTKRHQLVGVDRPGGGCGCSVAVMTGPLLRGGLGSPTTLVARRRAVASGHPPGLLPRLGGCWSAATASAHLIGGLLAAARVGRRAALVLTGEAGIGKSALLEDAVAAVPGAGDAGAARGRARSRSRRSPSAGCCSCCGRRWTTWTGSRRRRPRPWRRRSRCAPGPAGDRFAVGAATLSLLSRARRGRARWPWSSTTPTCSTRRRRRRSRSPPDGSRPTRSRCWPPSGPASRARSPRPGSPSWRSTGVPRGGGGAAARHGRPPAGRRRRPAAARGHRRQPAGAGRARPPAASAWRPCSPRLRCRCPRRWPAPSRCAPTGCPRPARTALLVAAAAGGDLGHRRPGLPGARHLAWPRSRRPRPPGCCRWRRAGRSSATAWSGPPSTRRRPRRAARGAPARWRRRSHADDADRRAWHLAEAALGPDEPAAAALLAAAGRGPGPQRPRRRGGRRRARRPAQPRPGRPRRAARRRGGVGGARRGRDRGRAARRGRRSCPARRRCACGSPRCAAPSPPGPAPSRRPATSSWPPADEAADDRPRRRGAAAGRRRPGLLPARGRRVAGRGRRARSTGCWSGRSSGPARWVATMASGVADVLTGRGGADRIRRAVLTAAPRTARSASDPRSRRWLVIGPLFLRESATGRDLVPTVVDDLRRRTDIGRLPLLLFHVARDQATTDAWDDAEVAYTEGIALAREAGQTADLAICLAGLAWLEARQGREDACRAHAEEARLLCAQRHLGVFTAWSLWALAELDLGRRPHRRGGSSGSRSWSRSWPSCGLDDVDLSPAPELVEALVAAGRPEQAARLVARLRGPGRAEGAALGAGPGRAGRRPHLRRRRGRRPLLRGAGPARLDARTPSRPRAPSSPYGARLRRAAPARRRPGPAARRPRRLRVARRRAVGRPGRRRAAGDRRDRRPPRAAGPRQSLTPQELQIARPARRAGGRRGRPPRRCSSARRRSSTTCGTCT